MIRLPQVRAAAAKTSGRGAPSSATRRRRTSSRSKTARLTAMPTAAGRRARARSRRRQRTARATRWISRMPRCATSTAGSLRARAAVQRTMWSRSRAVRLRRMRPASAETSTAGLFRIPVREMPRAMRSPSRAARWWMSTAAIRTALVRRRAIPSPSAMGRMPFPQGRASRAISMAATRRTIRATSS